MKTLRVALRSFVFVGLYASVSLAQQRTFVSGLGNDGNPCTRTAPCRTFAQAILGTIPGGEVVALDSAGYGPFSIRKSISIVAPAGVYAGISVSSGDGISVFAQSQDTIVLRGLTINNQGSTGNGIGFTSDGGGTLHVEGCVVNGFFATGLAFLGSGKLEVKDSIFRGGGIGIVTEPPAGTALALIDQVRLEGNIEGLHAADGSKVTVRGSIASGNVNGFEARSLNGTSVQLNLERCVASNNSTGIRASGDSSAPVEINVESCVVSSNSLTGILTLSSSTGAATIRVSNSTVTDNNFGLSSGGSPAVLLSRGNNTVEGNGTDTSGTIGSYTAK